MPALKLTLLGQDYLWLPLGMRLPLWVVSSPQSWQYNSHASTEIETSVLRLPVGTSGDGAALVGSLIPYRALPMSHILSKVCILL